MELFLALIVARFRVTVANFLSIFSSLMPYRKATKIEALEMRGMVF
jgi:hypothetical protein